MILQQQKAKMKTKISEPITYQPGIKNCVADDILEAVILGLLRLRLGLEVGVQAPEFRDVEELGKEPAESQKIQALVQRRLLCLLRLPGSCHSLCAELGGGDGSDNTNSNPSVTARKWTIGFPDCSNFEIVMEE